MLHTLVYQLLIYHNGINSTKKKVDLRAYGESNLDNAVVHPVFLLV